MAPTLSPCRRVPAESAHQPAIQAPGSSLLPVDAWLHLRNVLRLSDRELQIIQGVFDDEDLDNIAHTLAISREVVYRSTQRIYLKLRIGSRAELIVRMMSEYLAFVADQSQPEASGLSCWPVKLEKSLNL
jgi:DNA-binding NarL/FixJ family response regulator